MSFQRVPQRRHEGSRPSKGAHLGSPVLQLTPDVSVLSSTAEQLMNYCFCNCTLEKATRSAHHRKVWRAAEQLKCHWPRHHPDRVGCTFHRHDVHANFAFHQRKGDVSASKAGPSSKSANTTPAASVPAPKDAAAAPVPPDPPQWVSVAPLNSCAIPSAHSEPHRAFRSPIEKHLVPDPQRLPRGFGSSCRSPPGVRQSNKRYQRSLGKRAMEPGLPMT